MKQTAIQLITEAVLVVHEVDDFVVFEIQMK